MKYILLIDDEPSILKALKRSLKIPGYELDVFENPEDALAEMEVKKYDLIISDYRMPKMDGVSFLKFSRKFQPQAMRIILSGYADANALMAAINEAEIYRFIAKPWDDMDLQITLKKTLEYADLVEGNRQLLLQVKEQQEIIERQKNELLRLESESPGITRVNRSADGYIILNDTD